MRQVVITADTDGFISTLTLYSSRVLPVVGKPAKKTTVNGVIRMYLTQGSVVEINPTNWPYWSESAFSSIIAIKGLN